MRQIKPWGGRWLICGDNIGSPYEAAYREIDALVSLGRPVFTKLYHTKHFYAKLSALTEKIINSEQAYSTISI